jgi:N-acetylglutamate synthase-like GNAT family acetyltransferase
MPSIIYRKGNLDDLSKLQISEGLTATAASIEFNVLGVGHEYWIAIEGGTIVGLTVLGAPDPKEIRIMYVEVAASMKSQGVGTGLIQAILEHYPDREFSVIPSDRTEEFYRRLGFESTRKFEMRKQKSALR